jgi:hypothetical protein
LLVLEREKEREREREISRSINEGHYIFTCRFDLVAAGQVRANFCKRSQAASLTQNTHSKDSLTKVINARAFAVTLL